jgi:hypothetical protein
MKFIFLCLFLATLHHVFYAANYIVSNTNASGPGSLDEAIGNANGNPGKDTISFAITGMPPHVIPLTNSTAFEISDPVTIDGTTQPDNGYTGSCPKIILDASGVDPSLTELFNVFADDVLISGLWIKNFTNPGSVVLQLNGANAIIGTEERKNIFTNNYIPISLWNNNIRISNNYFGCSCDGITLEPNAYSAIAAPVNVDLLSITDNLISGNLNGIVLGNTVSPTTNVSIKGNKIGTDVTGTISLGNTIYGIDLTNVTNLELGGTGQNEGNLVSGNGRDGCLLRACSGTVYGNKIGTDITGSDTLPNDPLHMEYNAAFNCNGHSGLTSNLIIGGMEPSQQNIFFGNDIALNVADYSGQYEIINNLIGQTRAGIVSSVQYFGFQHFYDTLHINLESNFIYGVNACVYSEQGKNLLANANILGQDIHGNSLFPSRGYSMTFTDSFSLQNNMIRNCDEGILLNGCNDAYVGQNTIEDCNLPIAMIAGELFDCHHNRMYRNAISLNEYTINLHTGSPLAANDNIAPPIIIGSTVDSTWGTAMPSAIVVLSYDITLIPGQPQGFSYNVPPVTADANGHWAYAGYLERPDELTAMQTDVLNNSSGFALPLTVGIHDPSISTLNVYPIPATDFLFVEDLDEKSWKNWEIHNSMGAIIEKGKLANGTISQISVQHLMPGAYFLKVGSANHSVIRKWTKF